MIVLCTVHNVCDNHLLQAMVDEKERVSYKELMETIGWFFFDLFILRYVEDPVSGESFRMPGGLQLCIYVEVSCMHYTICMLVFINPRRKA